MVFQVVFHSAHLQDVRGRYSRNALTDLPTFLTQNHQWIFGLILLMVSSYCKFTIRFSPIGYGKSLVLIWFLYTGIVLQSTPFTSYAFVIRGSITNPIFVRCRMYTHSAEPNLLVPGFSTLLLKVLNLFSRCISISGF